MHRRKIEEVKEKLLLREKRKQMKSRIAIKFDSLVGNLQKNSNDSFQSGDYLPYSMDVSSSTINSDVIDLSAYDVEYSSLELYYTTEESLDTINNPDVMSTHNNHISSSLECYLSSTIKHSNKYSQPSFVELESHSEFLNVSDDDVGIIHKYQHDKIIKFDGDGSNKAGTNIYCVPEDTIESANKIISLEDVSVDHDSKCTLNSSNSSHIHDYNDDDDEIKRTGNVEDEEGDGMSNQNDDEDDETESTSVVMYINALKDNLINSCSTKLFDKVSDNNEGTDDYEDANKSRRKKISIGGCRGEDFNGNQSNSGAREFENVRMFSDDDDDDDDDGDDDDDDDDDNDDDEPSQINSSCLHNTSHLEVVSFSDFCENVTGNNLSDKGEDREVGDVVREHHSISTNNEPLIFNSIFPKLDALYTENVQLFSMKPSNICVKGAAMKSLEDDSVCGFVEDCISEKFEQTFSVELLLTKDKPETLKFQDAVCELKRKFDKCYKIVCVSNDNNYCKEIIHSQTDQAVQTDVSLDVHFDSGTKTTDYLHSSDNSKVHECLSLHRRYSKNNKVRNENEEGDKTMRQLMESEQSGKMEHLGRFLESLPTSFISKESSKSFFDDTSTICSSEFPDMSGLQTDSRGRILNESDFILSCQDELESWRTERYAELERKKREIIEQCRIQMEKLSIEHEEEELKLRQKMLSKRKKTFSKIKKSQRKDAAASIVSFCTQTDATCSDDEGVLRGIDHHQQQQQQQHNSHGPLENDNMVTNSSRASRIEGVPHEVFQNRNYILTPSTNVSISCKASSPKRGRKKFIENIKVVECISQESMDECNNKLPGLFNKCDNVCLLSCNDDLLCSAMSLHSKRKVAFDILCSKLGALIKGYIVRRLMRSQKVQQIVTTLTDTAKEVVSILPKLVKSEECSREDAIFLETLDRQLMSVFDKLHEIFFGLPSKEQMNIIANQRSIEHNMPYKASGTPREKQLSLATKKVLERRNKSIQLNQPTGLEMMSSLSSSNKSELSIRQSSFITNQMSINDINKKNNPDNNKNNNCEDFDAIKNKTQETMKNIPINQDCPKKYNLRPRPTSNNMENAHVKSVRSSQTRNSKNNLTSLPGHSKVPPVGSQKLGSRKKTTRVHNS